MLDAAAPAASSAATRSLDPGQPMPPEPDRTRRSVPIYGRTLDIEALLAEFSPAPDYFDTTYLLPPHALRALQERRFLAQVARGWQIPFYRRHWRAAGLEPGDIRGLADLGKLPPFSVHDLRDSLARDPLWPDYIGIDPASDEPMPLVMQTSGGTTGLPRPMIFSPRDREVMNIITGRRLFMQGVRPFDLVQVALSLGLANGGMLAREGIWKYTGAVPVMTGAGAQTPTRRQVELLRAWKVTHIAGFPAYLRHMGMVARDEMGIDPRSLSVRGLIVHLGTDDRSALEDLWGADAYDTYGSNECGSMAAECAHKTGMHVFEDAFVMEILDAGTGAEAAPGEKGVVHLTTLFKHLAPMIRFNTNDVSAFCTDGCACGGTHRRIAAIYGRADNMVKLRGTNVFPEAIGALVARQPGATGEYVCILHREEGRDAMTVQVEAADDDVDRAALAASLSARLREALGVGLGVEIVARGATDVLTGLSATSKIRRLIDRRDAAPHQTGNQSR